jgi:hypothetical protein
MNETTRWAEISALLDALFELDAPAREQELQRIEARDPALAKKVRAMLRADADTGLLERGIASAVPDVMHSLASGRGGAEPEPDSDSIEAAGHVIGRWRVLR